MNILDLFSSVNSVSSVLKSPVPEAPTADDLADALDHLELQAEHAQAMAQDSPDVFIKAATNIAAMDFFTVLNRFDTAPLSKRLEEKPELYFQMINTYVNFMRANLERQKFEFKKEQAKARQREREQKLRTRKPILLSDATLATFNRVAAAAQKPESHAPNPEPRPTNHDASSTTDSAQTVLLQFVIPPSFESKNSTAETPDLECERVPIPYEPSDAPTEDLLCCAS